MTRDQLDELALLAAANPVREPLDEGEQPTATALLERIFEEPTQQPGGLDHPRRPRGRRRLALAGGGALALTTIVAVLLILPGGKGTDAVAHTVKALSATEGVFHVVTQTTIDKPNGARTQAWTETWVSADGRRSRSLLYDVTPSGRRGRLVAEKVGDTTVIRGRPRDGGPISSSDTQLALRLRTYMLGLLRQGRVTKRTAVTIAGRSAWRFEIVTRMRRSLIQTPARSTIVPASIRHTVLIVDQRTHLPLLLRTNGVIPAIADSRDRRVTYPTQTTTARFAAFERLTNAQGAAGLKPSRRFQSRK